MQELDRFNGVVIVTTNLVANDDPALLRRISRHIKFRLPDKAMRRRLQELFARHGASAALSAKATIKPTKEFHAAWHTLFSVEQNHELDKVVPIVVGAIVVGALPLPPRRSSNGFTFLPNHNSDSQSAFPRRRP